MARKRRAKVAELFPNIGTKNPLVGSRFIRLLEDELDSLHQAHAHGNREFCYDHLVVAHLIAFFNPVLTGLRSIEDLFEQPQVRERFELPRLPKSTVSDAQRLFDPHLLAPLMDSLRDRLAIAPHDPRLDTLTRRLLAVDGSFFAVASRIAWAFFNTTKKGAIRAHVHFDLATGVPDHISLTDPHTTEASQLSLALQSGCLYIMDRGFENYDLLADILKSESDFVVRLRKTAVCQVLEHRPLSAAAQTAGVISDTVVEIGWREDHRPVKTPLRCVEIAIMNRKGEKEIIRLLTNRLNVSADLIALLYQHRWQLELFFRWFKCMAHFKHFFSESQTGMLLQIYVAIIGTLLLAVATASRPSKYDYSLIACAMAGLGTIHEALAAAEKRRAERARASEQRKARIAAQKKAN